MSGEVQNNRQKSDIYLGFGGGLLHSNSKNHVPGKIEHGVMWPLKDSPHNAGYFLDIHMGESVIGGSVKGKYSYDLNEKVSITGGLGAEYNKFKQLKDPQFMPKSSKYDVFISPEVYDRNAKVKGVNYSETTVFGSVGANYNLSKGLQLSGSLDLGCKLSELPSDLESSERSKEPLKPTFSGKLNVGASYNISEILSIGVNGSAPLSKKSDGYVGLSLGLRF